MVSMDVSCHLYLDIGQWIFKRYVINIGNQNTLLSNMHIASYKQSHIIIVIPNLFSIRQPEYEQYYSQHFGTTKDFAVYAAETYSSTLYLLGL